MEFHLDNPFQFSGECSEQIIIASLFSAEDLHVAAVSVPHALTLRRDTVSLIRQLTETPGGVDHYVAYLAVNYLDRFISKHEILSFLPWSPAFLSATCLSIAAKMLDFRFSVAKFQEMRPIDFDPANVDRMEFVLVEALDWRLRSITAFAFLGYFIRFIQSYPIEFLRDIRDRASRKLIRAQYGMDRSIATEVWEHQSCSTMCAIYGGFAFLL
ncbi:cyclin-D6-1-like [Zingiber officinale]|uniref:cyclin-D6-1-like n=1 Tax=Zingiber officinale TaxID=94328 RepID=UPI001C4C16C0|nr:cyclin-D6-1-like [Zingiber officinale]